MSEKLSEENRALIKHLESRLGISPQMADYLIEHWGQANILLNVAREEGEERLRAAMKRQWREDETCRRLDDVRANIAGLRPGDAEAIAAFQQEFIRMKDAARAEARPAPVVDREAVATLVDRLWQDLCEKDDRNSPAEYPDMLLISHDELSACVDAILALLSPATSPGEEGSSGAESARTGTLPVLTEGQHSAGGGKIPGVEEVIRYLRNYGPGTPDTTDLYFMRWAADHLCNLVSREAFWRSQAQTSEAG